MRFDLRFQTLDASAIWSYPGYLHEASVWIPGDAHSAGSFTKKKVRFLEALFREVGTRTLAD